MEIFVRHDGQELGPFTKEQIFAFLTEGRFHAEDLARTGEVAEWRPLKEVIRGATTLFSVEQIEATEIQDTPIPIILQPSEPRKRVEEEGTTNDFWKWVGLAACFIGALAAGALFTLRSAQPTVRQPDPVASQPAPRALTPHGNQPAIVAFSTPENAKTRSTPSAVAGEKTPTVADQEQGKPAGFPQIAKTAPSPTPPEALNQVLQQAPLSIEQLGAGSGSFEIKRLHVLSAALPGKTVWKQVPDAKIHGKIDRVLVHLPQKGLFESVPDPKNPGKIMRQFVPCIWVEVGVREKTSTAGVFAKVYIYDMDKKLITTLPVPSSCPGGLPAFLESGTACDLFVPVPKDILNTQFNALAVIGGHNESAAKLLTGDIFDYSYPERDLVARPGTEISGKKKVVDPVVELAVHTTNLKQPVLTLLMRPPKGIDDYSEVKGVLCASLLANSPEDIRQMLLATESDTFGDKFAFADEHKLAIIAWGARTIWTKKNYLNHNDKEVRQADRDFDEVADAWERGVTELGKTYGVPTRNFLLWGYCNSGHWAHRLALRKPEYFLAVHIHIPNNFDEPRPEANRILWLITAGERDPGYEPSKRFFQDAKSLNYPIIYKAVIGMGHWSSRITDDLGSRFFEYALSLQAAREAYDKVHWGALGTTVGSSTSGPWVEGFRSPSYYGDIVNQACFPAAQAKMIPGPFRTALPTKDLADAWNYKIIPPADSAAVLRPSNAGRNLALNKPFICSNPAAIKSRMAGLNDGSWDKCFASGDSPLFPKTVTIDLQQEANVNAVLLGVPMYSPTKTIVVAISDDGTSFVDVGSYTFKKGNEEQHLYSFNAKPTRYVRLIYPDHYDKRLSVYTSEVEVYATGNQL